jgi:hypothetical protein
MPAEHAFRLSRSALKGHPMKVGVATNHAYYVLRINGHATSTHRRYEDALKAGLELKYQFPHDDIKVEEMEQDTILH